MLFIKNIARIGNTLPFHPLLKDDSIVVAAVLKSQLSQIKGAIIIFLFLDFVD